MKTLTIRDLSPVLKKTEATIRSDMVRNPGSLPRWFKLPGSRRPLWLEATVEQFLQRQAAKAGALPDIEIGTQAKK